MSYVKEKLDLIQKLEEAKQKLRSELISIAQSLDFVKNPEYDRLYDSKDIEVLIAIAENPLAPLLSKRYRQLFNESSFNVLMAIAGNQNAAIHSEFRHLVSHPDIWIKNLAIKTCGEFIRKIEIFYPLIDELEVPEFKIDLNIL